MYFDTILKLFAGEKRVFPGLSPKLQEIKGPNLFWSCFISLYCKLFIEYYIILKQWTVYVTHWIMVSRDPIN